MGANMARRLKDQGENWSRGAKASWTNPPSLDSPSKTEAPSSAKRASRKHVMSPLVARWNKATRLGQGEKSTPRSSRHSERCFSCVD